MVRTPAGLRALGRPDDVEPVSQNERALLGVENFSLDQPPTYRKGGIQRLLQHHHVSNLLTAGYDNSGVGLRDRNAEMGGKEGGRETGGRGRAGSRNILRTLKGRRGNNPGWGGAMISKRRRANSKEKRKSLIIRPCARNEDTERKATLRTWASMNVYNPLRRSKHTTKGGV